MRTEEAYEEPLNAAESYQALLGSLGISYSDLLHAADAVEWTEDRIAELRDQADTQSRTMPRRGNRWRSLRRGSG